jgi:large subunit ribosomal protein L25
MLQVEMTAGVRTATGKGPMRQLRSEGQTPAVVYGAGKEALALKFDTKSLMISLLEIYRRNAVVKLKIDDGSEKNVVVKEVQTDPVTDVLVHADFCEIDLEQAKNFEVPLRYKGTAKGVDLGGFLRVASDVIVLKGRPLDIPDECSLDVTGLNIGDSLTFSAIEIPASVELISEADSVCVGVYK